MSTSSNILKRLKEAANYARNRHWVTIELHELGVEVILRIRRDEELLGDRHVFQWEELDHSRINAIINFIRKWEPDNLLPTDFHYNAGLPEFLIKEIKKKPQNGH